MQIRINKYSVLLLNIGQFYLLHYSLYDVTLAVGVGDLGFLFARQQT